MFVAYLGRLKCIRRLSTNGTNNQHRSYSFLFICHFFLVLLLSIVCVSMFIVQFTSNQISVAFNRKSHALQWSNNSKITSKMSMVQQKSFKFAIFRYRQRRPYSKYNHTCHQRRPSVMKIELTLCAPVPLYDWTVENDALRTNEFNRYFI